LTGLRREHSRQVGYCGKAMLMNIVTLVDV